MSRCRGRCRESSWGRGQSIELRKAARNVLERRIFHHRSHARRAENPNDRGLTRHAREPHENSDYACVRIHFIDSHTYPFSTTPSSERPSRHRKGLTARLRGDAHFYCLSKAPIAYHHREAGIGPSGLVIAFCLRIPWSHPKTRWWRETKCNRTRFTRATSDCPPASC